MLATVAALAAVVFVDLNGGGDRDMPGSGRRRRRQAMPSTRTTKDKDL
jgi:hypothetical protein